MQSVKLRDGLIAARDRSEATGACPEAHVLARIANGYWPEESTDYLREHISRCSRCVPRLADLSRIARRIDEQVIPELTLQRARDLARRRWLRRVPAWAAAAVLVLAVGATVARYATDPAGIAPVDPITEMRDTRSIDTRALVPDLLEPAAGSVLETEDATFRWRELPGSLYYDIRLVTAQGDLVWEERVNDTRWNLPVEVRLEDGADYFVRVDAFLAEGKRVSSRHVQFTVGGQE